MEIADLNTPLGYQGNCTIFPLKENNAITLMMMQDYLEIGEMAELRDPDEASNYSTEEIIEYIKCRREHDPSGDESDRR